MGDLWTSMTRLSCIVFLFVCLQACVFMFFSLQHEKVLYQTFAAGTTKDDEFLSRTGYEGEVAVCISGQVARWQPHHLVEGLLKANPQFRFYLFFNIQAHHNHSDIVYNTDPDNVFQQSYMAGLSYAESWRKLTEMNNLVNSRVISLHFISAKNAEQLKSTLNVKVLDRITQYLHVQVSILNMYSHHIRCIDQIIYYEQRRRATDNSTFRFDYIASTREDVYFFRPMNLTPIARIISNQSQPCDIPFKRCLNFWGFNMRFYLLRREVGIKFLGNRLSFYRFMMAINRTVENPERFELNEAVALQLAPCPMSVEDYPVTATRQLPSLGSGLRSGLGTSRARPLQPTAAVSIRGAGTGTGSSNSNSEQTSEGVDDAFCFIWFEINRCVPKASQPFVRQHLCTEIRRKRILQTRYGINQWEIEYHRIFNYSYGHAPIMLDERFKALRPSQYTLHRANSHLSAHHSNNASHNLELVRSKRYMTKYPSLSHLCKDVAFIEKTWRPDY